MPRFAFALVFMNVVPSLASEPTVRFTLGTVVPKGGRLELKLVSGKLLAPIVVTDFTGPTKLPQNGPYNLTFTPKGGLPIEVMSNWKAEDDKALCVSDAVGVIVIRGDDLPRASSVVVAAITDPGPGERGHIPIQKASNYKEDLVVLPGTYSVWVVPFNGAKAQRIADNVRVLAGREVKQ